MARGLGGLFRVGVGERAMRGNVWARGNREVHWHLPCRSASKEGDHSCGRNVSGAHYVFIFCDAEDRFVFMSGNTEKQLGFLRRIWAHEISFFECSP